MHCHAPRMMVAARTHRRGARRADRGTWYGCTLRAGRNEAPTTSRWEWSGRTARRLYLLASPCNTRILEYLRVHVHVLRPGVVRRARRTVARLAPGSPRRLQRGGACPPARVRVRVLMLAPARPTNRASKPAAEVCPHASGHLKAAVARCGSAACGCGGGCCRFMCVTEARRAREVGCGGRAVCVYNSGGGTRLVPSCYMYR